MEDLDLKHREQDSLTEREIEVLQRVIAGKSNIVIAKELFITPHTVKAHISSILKKFGVKTRLEAAVLALSSKMFEKPEEEK